LAFRIAGSIALKNGMAKAKSVLLEPIMKLSAIAPQQFLGDIISDINSRRGQIEAIETYGDTSAVHVMVPLAEVFGYATNLRSLTQGRATYSMQFECYRAMPSELAEQIIVVGKGYA